MKKILILILGLILFNVNQTYAVDFGSDDIEIVCMVDQDQPQTVDVYVSMEAYEVYVEEYTSTLIYKVENVPIMADANYSGQIAQFNKRNIFVYCNDWFSYMYDDDYTNNSITRNRHGLSRGEPLATNRGKLLLS